MKTVKVCLAKKKEMRRACHPMTAEVLSQLQMKRKMLDLLCRLADSKYQLSPWMEGGQKGVHHNDSRHTTTGNLCKGRISSKQNRSQQWAHIFMTKEETTQVTIFLTRRWYSNTTGLDFPSTSTHSWHWKGGLCSSETRVSLTNITTRCYTMKPWTRLEQLKSQSSPILPPIH